MLTLRIDVDKPYGNHTLIRKLASKFFEETALPVASFGYLEHLSQFLDLLLPHKIKAVFYFRLCTIPTSELAQRLVREGHAIGLHAENTRSYETFLGELQALQSKLPGIKLHSFSKHGSGVRKLGRFHYPPYEPAKYVEWGEQAGVPFLYGNEAIVQANKDASPQSIFWLERDYRASTFSNLEQLISLAQTQGIVVLTHPENVIRDLNCQTDLEALIALAQVKNVQWEDFNPR